MKYFGWIFLFFIMVYIVPLGSHPLRLPEYRNAEITREMLVSSDLTTPRMLGINDFKNPPMNYWLTAGSFRLFGHNTFANRLPAALAAGLTALLTALLIHQALRDEKLAALAAILCMTGALPFFAGTSATPDSVFAMFVISSQGLLFLAAQEPGFNRRKQLLIFLAGLSIGAAFLTKGFPALIIPALTMCAYLLWQRKWKEFLLLPIPVLIVTALVILPWAWKINHSVNGFWQIFIFAEQLPLLTTSGCAASPWWFYMPVLVLGILPGGLLLPAALATGKNAWKNIFSQDLFCYSLCAIIMPLIFLSIIPVKSPAWLLVCTPPAAILIAAGVRAYFNAGGHHRAYNWVMSLWGILMLVTGAAGVTGWFFRHCIPACVTNNIPLSFTVLITGGAAAILCGVLMLYSLRGNWRGRLYLFFFGAALLPLGAAWCITPAKWMPEPALRIFIENFQLTPSKTEFITVKELAPALAWSTKKTDIKIVNCAFPLCRETGNTGHITDLSGYITRSKRQYPAALILPQDHALLKTVPQPAQKSSAWGLVCLIYDTVK